MIQVTGTIKENKLPENRENFKKGAKQKRETHSTGLGQQMQTVKLPMKRHS